MSDYATPRYVIAIAEELDVISCNLKQRGPENVRRQAERLRRLADILERKT